MAFVQYVSGAVIQLVALPLLGVGAAVLARSSEQQRAMIENQRQEDHAELAEILADVRKLLAKGT